MGLISRVSSRTYRSFNKIPGHKMVFTKHVEIGRVVVVPCKQAIYTIVDVVDSKHVMIDSPKKDSRCKINMNNIQLTKFKLDFLHGARTATVKKAWEAAGMARSGLRPPGPRPSPRRTPEPTSATSSDSRS